MSYQVFDRCPGCSAPITWDSEDQFWNGDKSVDCPGCGATLYCFGAALCCYRLEEAPVHYCGQCGWAGTADDYHACPGYPGENEF